MKSYMYTPDVQSLVMPQTRNIQEWEDFLEKLMEMDYAAPFYVIFSQYQQLNAADFEVPPAVYGDLYNDLGTKICGRDHYAAFDAAVNTGFYGKGVRMIAAAVIADGGKDPNLLAGAREAFWGSNLLEAIPKDAAAVLAKLLKEEGEVEVSEASPYEEFVQDYSEDTTENIKEDPAEKPSDSEVDYMTWWIQRLEGAMETDEVAAASILSYFLEEKVGHPCTIYCPLGHEPYREVAQKMVDSKVMMEAARKSGLLATGVEMFVTSALSNEDCWECMKDGVAYLTDDPDLRCFIPFYNRYVIEGLLELTTDIERGAVKWDAAYQKLKEEYGGEMRGY